MGVSEPTFGKEELAKLKAEDRQRFRYNGEEITRYQASQIQRRLETAIRKQKDVAVIAAAADDIVLRREVQAKINELNDEYVRISDISGLPMQRERLSVSGFYRVKAET